ncbi:MAG: UDP-forming cellulose synthase catalytic subunit [Thiotrichales bacterium]
MQNPINPLVNALHWLGLIAAFLLVLLVSSVPLTLEQQLIFATVALGFSWLVRLGRNISRYRMIVLIIISVLASGRYIYWRITESMAWFDPQVTLTVWDHVLSLGLLLAELYAWSVLFLGYFQTIWPLRRPTLELPADRSQWPSVDVLIPTYSEPLKVVAPSVLAAKNIDWPSDKINIFLLDDGGRSEFEQFALQSGVRYIHRDTNAGAKAGNINNALSRSSGEYIAIFDSDHVPVRSFLTKTMGWFLRDRKLGLVQTPHLFFTPDPVERNLQIYHRVPNEGQLFYGLVQDGNDTWNASFFCGSCAVLRRDALADIGGIAEDTVTEDAHTSLVMQKHGWNSAYINIPLAAGMATERLSGHIRQRVRWARGMTQIFRKDNPLIAKGLSFAQRLNYFNAMMHFFFGLPRIIFLTAPLAYLFFETYVIQASAAMIAVFALPHIFQAHVANSAMQGRYRHSFWAEVYETLLAPHILFPTIMTFFFPKLGSFNVTAKGGVIDKDHFDWTSSRFIFTLLVLNLAGLCVGMLRLFWWNPDETGTVIINLAWTLFNATIIGAALAVAWEKRQRRANARIHRTYPALLRTLDGGFFLAATADISTGDISLRLDEPAVNLKPDDYVIVELLEGAKPYRFKGRLATVSDQHVGIRLEHMSVEKLAQLVYFSHGHDAAWDAWYNACEPTKPLYSFFEIMRFGIGGAFRALFGHNDDPESQVRPGFAATGWLLVLLLVLLAGAFAPKNANAETADVVAVDPSPAGVIPPRDPGTEIGEWNQIALKFSDLGIDNPLRLRGGNTQHDVWFALRSDRIVRKASIHLKYSLAPELRADYSQFQLSLNGIELGLLTLETLATGETIEQEFAVDPLYVSDLNQLSLKLIPREQDFCEKLDPKLKEALISEDSEIRMTEGPLNLVNDLALFPIPFFDQFDDQRLVIPVVLADRMLESPSAIKAAGILASWFGALADYRGANFPVLVDALPDRHGVILTTAEHPHPLLAGHSLNGPGVALVSHPEKPQIKLLALLGRNDEDLISAAAMLISRHEPLASDRVEFVAADLPAPRNRHDVPNWLPVGQKSRLGDLLTPDRLVVRGLNPNPVDLKFRVPPDLYRWKHDSVPFHVSFSHTDLPLRSDSKFSVDINQDGLRSYVLGASKGIFSSVKPFPTRLPDTHGYTPEFTTQHEKIALPIYELVGHSQLTQFFDFQIPEQYGTDCINLYTQHLTGKVDPDSHIDLRGYLHFTRLPDLAKFVNMGFPFTRHADLAETAVVMPRTPTPAEIQAALELMGRMGNATGNPAFHVSVLNPAQIDTAREKDILIVGASDDSELLAQWQAHLPVHSTNTGWALRQLSLRERFDLWWQAGESSDLKGVRELLEAQGENLVALTGFPSPYSANRSVVAVLTRAPDGLTTITEALNDPAQTAKVQGDFAAFSPGDVRSVRILPVYHVGDLPFFTGLSWYLSSHLLTLIVISLILALVTAALIAGKMRQVAAARLALENERA